MTEAPEAADSEAEESPKVGEPVAEPAIDEKVVETPDADGIEAAKACAPETEEPAEGEPAAGGPIIDGLDAAGDPEDEASEAAEGSDTDKSAPALLCALRGPCATAVALLLEG